MDPIGARGNLMQIIALAFSLLVLTSGAAPAQAPQVDRVDFVEYGIYTLDRVIEGRDGFGIKEARATNIRHAASLRTIPAEIGVTFGFRYKVIGSPNGAPVDLRKIVIFPPPGIFPPLAAGSIERDEFRLHAKVGETSYVSYTLEDDFELVPGVWEIEIWNGERKLGSQTFRVINPNAECEHALCEGF
jgi:hypothetical protein